MFLRRNVNKYSHWNFNVNNYGRRQNVYNYNNQFIPKSYSNNFNEYHPLEGKFDNFEFNTHKSHSNESFLTHDLTIKKYFERGKVYTFSLYFMFYSK